METLIAHTSSNILMGTVIAAEILSILALFVVLFFYRIQIRKYRALLDRLGDPNVYVKTGRILIPAYVILTIVLTFVTILLYLFQPHLL